MKKQTIHTGKAPAAIGPYSQAIKAGNFLFISGQLPIDPAVGSIIDGTIGERTGRIMENAQEIARAAETTLAQTVKTTIFLTDLNDFQEVNSAYAAFFSTAPPARSTVQVAALPLGSNIEIEFIVAL